MTRFIFGIILLCFLIEISDCVNNTKADNNVPVKPLKRKSDKDTEKKSIDELIYKPKPDPKEEQGKSNSSDSANKEEEDVSEETNKSKTLFFILIVTGICIIVAYIFNSVVKLISVPESIAIIGVGAIIGCILRLTNVISAEKEAFPPTIFFLVILPPIIFESGYDLNKGNFFANIGSILVFAVIGTVISALVVGGGLILAAKYKLIYPFSVIECLAFASLISAIDPVATLTIFQALKVDPVLYMLVFGESILNDAIAVVLTTSVASLSNTGADQDIYSILGAAFWHFLVSFLASSAIGISFGLLTALLLKWCSLHSHTTFEQGLIFVLAYAPYSLAEAMGMSGIMAILFAGVTMSHYAHLNLSAVSQITIRQTFKTLSCLAETCMFAYLGLAIFSFKHRVEYGFVGLVLLLCLLGRALNVFPLALILNLFRTHKITFKNQFIMWFSGLRGAIAFALCLHLDWVNKLETQQILITTTLIITIATIVFLGGSTMPLINFIESLNSMTDRKKPFRRRSNSYSWTSVFPWRSNADKNQYSKLATMPSSLENDAEYQVTNVDDEEDTNKMPGQSKATPRRQRTVSLDFTKCKDITTDPMHFNNINMFRCSDTSTSSDDEQQEGHNSTRIKKKGLHSIPPSMRHSICSIAYNDAHDAKQGLTGFAYVDAKYFIPFFTRKLSKKDIQSSRNHLLSLSTNWLNPRRVKKLSVRHFPKTKAKKSPFSIDFVNVP